MDVDDPSTVGREVGTAQQTSPLAHTSCLRFVSRKLTERVLKVTVSCQRGLFQQSLIGTEARVFHDVDADVHEEMCTYVVLSDDTSLFQDIGERMPTTPAPETMQIKVICTPERNHSMWIGQASPLHPRWHKRAQGRHVDILQVISRALAPRCDKSDVRVRRADRTSDPRQSRSLFG